jgi:hypothetical protein
MTKEFKRRKGQADASFCMQLAFTLKRIRIRKKVNSQND